MTITDLLKSTAVRVPEKTAFEDGEKSITYPELLSSAEKICTEIHSRLGVKKNPVAVFIDRNIESICSFLGIAMSRNFYVPIDISLPEKRIITILDQMKPAAAVAAAKLPSGLEDLITIPVFEYEDLIKGEADTALCEKLQSEATDTDPLYAICTSGSTGVPKGVLVSNRSVLDFIPVFCETFDLNENDIFANQAPFDFDVSVKDIYSAIYLGASVYIVPRICFIMPKLLIDRLIEKKITVIVWAVSALSLVAELNLFEYGIPDHIKKVLFSGEVMPVKMLNIWRAALPDAMFVNLYGPTEITCNCLYYIVDRDFKETEKLPLGGAFKNETVLVLNEKGLPAGVGEEGEICVLGTCLALGYYNNPEKTAAAFVQNPLNKSYPELMYRTGDMAVRNENGELFFAARKDFQIKHMGHRIELEEIELHLNASEGVTRASCMYDDQKSRLIAFYTGSAANKEIINGLKKLLPKYMIPNKFIQLEALPLNKNGKIDRQKLLMLYVNETNEPKNTK